MKGRGTKTVGKRNQRNSQNKGMKEEGRAGKGTSLGKKKIERSQNISAHSQAVKHRKEPSEAAIPCDTYSYSGTATFVTYETNYPRSTSYLYPTASYPHGHTIGQLLPLNLQ